MPSYRRIGHHGRAVPIVGRRLSIRTVVCRVCRRFGPGMGTYQAEANAKCESAGWTELEGEYGICPHCRMMAAILEVHSMAENNPTQTENTSAQVTAEKPTRIALPAQLAAFEQEAAKAKWEAMSGAPTHQNAKFYRGTGEDGWSFTVASFDIAGSTDRGYDGAVVHGPFIGHVPADAAQRLFAIADRACTMQDPK